MMRTIFCLKSFWSVQSLLQLDFLQGAVQQGRSHHFILTRRTMYNKLLIWGPTKILTRRSKYNKLLILGSYKYSPVDSRLHPKTDNGYGSNHTAWVGPCPSEWFKPSVKSLQCVGCPSHNWHFKDITPIADKYFAPRLSYWTTGQCLKYDFQVAFVQFIWRHCLNLISQLHSFHVRSCFYLCFHFLFFSSPCNDGRTSGKREIKLLI